MNISGVGIGPGNPCRVVAEIGNSHNGKGERDTEGRERAHRLIEAAAIAQDQA